MQGIDRWSMAAGVVLTVAGLVLVGVGVFFHWAAFIYGFGALVVGVVILATLRRQEYIEPIREKVKKKRK